jgi:hypothetical protein
MILEIYAFWVFRVMFRTTHFIFFQSDFAETHSFLRLAFGLSLCRQFSEWDPNLFVTTVETGKGSVDWQVAVGRVYHLRLGLRFRRSSHAPLRQQRWQRQLSGSSRRRRRHRLWKHVLQLSGRRRCQRLLRDERR